MRSGSLGFSQGEWCPELKHPNLEVFPPPNNDRYLIPYRQDLIPIRSNLAKRELGLFLVNRNRDHLSTLHVHGIIREDGQPVPPPQRARI